MAYGGHSFGKKTFHKPTYCHHCSDLLWGLIGQGYICEGTNFISLIYPPTIFHPYVHRRKKKYQNYFLWNGKIAKNEKKKSHLNISFLRSLLFWLHLFLYVRKKKLNSGKISSHTASISIAHSRRKFKFSIESLNPPWKMSLFCLLLWLT